MQLKASSKGSNLAIRWKKCKSIWLAISLLATIFPLILNTFNWNCLENNGWFQPSNPKSDRGNRTKAPMTPSYRSYWLNYGGIISKSDDIKVINWIIFQEILQCKCRWWLSTLWFGCHEFVPWQLVVGTRTCDWLLGFS